MSLANVLLRALTAAIVFQLLLPATAAAAEAKPASVKPAAAAPKAAAKAAREQAAPKEPELKLRSAAENEECIIKPVMTDAEIDRCRRSPR